MNNRPGISTAGGAGYRRLPAGLQPPPSYKPMQLPPYLGSTYYNTPLGQPKPVGWHQQRWQHPAPSVRTRYPNQQQPKYTKQTSYAQPALHTFATGGQLQRIKPQANVYVSRQVQYQPYKVYVSRYRAPRPVGNPQLARKSPSSIVSDETRRQDFRTRGAYSSTNHNPPQRQRMMQPQNQQRMRQPKRGRKRTLFWAGIGAVNTGLKMLDDPKYQPINKVAEDELKEEEEAAAAWLQMTPADQRLHKLGGWFKTGIQFVVDAHDQTTGENNSEQAMLQARQAALFQDRRRKLIDTQKSAMLNKYHKDYPNLIKMWELKRQKKKQSFRNRLFLVNHNGSQERGYGEEFSSDETSDSNSDSDSDSDSEEFDDDQELYQIWYDDYRPVFDECDRYKHEDHRYRPDSYELSHCEQMV